MSNTDDAASQDARTRLPIAKIALGLVGIVALLLLGREAGGYIEPFRAWVGGLGAAAPIVFGVVYVIAVIALAPASLLTIAGGAAFGLLKGALIVFFAAVAGASLAFLIARYVARDAIERRFGGNPKFVAIDRAVGKEGLKIAFLLRLTPAVPFNFLNYILGLTTVSLRDYLLAFIGMIPGTFLYVYIGSLTTEVAAAAAGDGAETGKLILNVVAFAATVVVTVIVTRIARRALAEAAGEIENQEA